LRRQTKRPRPKHPPQVVREKEIFLGPFACSGATKTPKRPRSAPDISPTVSPQSRYEQLRVQHVAASAPLARRLLASLLDPKFVRDFDAAAAAVPTELHSKTAITAICEPNVPSATIATVDIANTIPRKLKLVKLEGQLTEETQPTQALVTANNRAVSAVADTQLVPGSPVGSPAASVIDTEQEETCMEPSRKRVRFSTPSPESVLSFSLGRRDLDQRLEAAMAAAHVYAVEKNRSVDQQASTENSCLLQEADQKQEPAPAVSSDTTTDPMEVAGALPTDVDTGVAATYRVSDDAVKSLVELLTEQSIDASFIDALRTSNEPRLPPSSTETKPDSQPESNEQTEHFTSPMLLPPADTPQDEYALTLLAANYKTLMNIRRMRAEAECAGPARQSELEKVERASSIALATGIASLAMKLPPRMLARPLDVARAALTLAGSKPNVYPDNFVTHD
jgi:hypothetical protein